MSILDRRDLQMRPVCIETALVRSVRTVSVSRDTTVACKKKRISLMMMMIVLFIDPCQKQTPYTCKLTSFSSPSLFLPVCPCVHACVHLQAKFDMLIARGEIGVNAEGQQGSSSASYVSAGLQHRMSVVCVCVCLRVSACVVLLVLCCVCVCVCVRERERDSARARGRARGREAERQRGRAAERQSGREAEDSDDHRPRGMLV